MTKKLRFIWIDDNPSRRPSAVSLERKLGVSVNFIGVKNKNLDSVLTDIQINNEPDLILLDHKLEDGTTGIFKIGSTVATYLREKWPECPIVGISAVNREEVDSSQRLAYEEFYSISKISSHYSTIMSIAKSFKKLKDTRPKDISAILKVMKAPRDEFERIKSIMPQGLRENFEDRSLIVDISRWMRTVFLERAGFVYDRLWVSTLIGIKIESFHKVEALFESAKYTGIFCDNSNEKWWKTKVLDILSESIQTSGLPWEKGRSLPNITRRDYSQCYATGEDYPEVVAYTDQTPNASRAPMKLKNTISHPNYEDLLFFDEIRLMKSAE